MQPDASVISSGRVTPQLLQLECQDILERHLETLGDGLSEYCFSNLYLFRETHHYTYLDGEFPSIRGKTYDGCLFIMPLFDFSEIGHDQLTKLCENVDFVFPVSDQMVAKLDPKRFRVEFNYADSDYVYSAEKLRTYKGRKLSKKRNLMNQFLQMNSPHFKILNEELYEEALDVLNQWQLDTTKPENDTDYFSCLEAVLHVKRLGLVGLLYYVGAEPAGFILGKEVYPGMFAIHFAKGRGKYKGIFQYMFNHFANYMAERVKYFNFEQDLGKLNFRKTKRSYDPDRLLHKFRVTPQ